MTSLKPRSQISCMVCHVMPCSSIHSKVSCGGQYPRRPTWTKWVPGTAPDSISRRIGVPWLARLPVDDVRGVGVRVEVHDADVAVAVHVGHRRRGRPGDRVVAAEDDRHDAAGRHRVNALADVRVRRPRSGRAGSTHRRSRRPPASRRSPARGPGGRCPARRRWPGSPGDRTGRPAGSWSPRRTVRRRSRRRVARTRVVRPRSGTAGDRTTRGPRGASPAAQPFPAAGPAAVRGRADRPWA